VRRRLSGAFGVEVDDPGVMKRREVGLISFVLGQSPRRARIPTHSLVTEAYSGELSQISFQFLSFESEPLTTSIMNSAGLASCEREERSQ